MAKAVHIPRVNNNDDEVRVATIFVRAGDAVKAGDLLMQVETEKATVDVEAETDGHILAVLCEASQAISVGAVALWVGATSDDAVPQVETHAVSHSGTTDAGATAKARVLLSRHGLDVDLIPRAGARLTAADVEAYLATHPGQVFRKPVGAQEVELPAEAEIGPLSPIARGMLSTVTWQRDHAAATYLEIDYDPRPWAGSADAFRREHRLLFNPLLALLAHRLTQIAPELGANGTILEGNEPRFVRYRKVNLGFTVQAGEVLYLCVVEGADRLHPLAFVNRLFDLQRRAMGHKLAPAEMAGATIGFTSMARWGVQRHQPVLAPNTGIMAAHAASAPGGERAVLGVTYDHRLLSGFDAVRLLKKLAQPAS